MPHGICEGLSFGLRAQREHEGNTKGTQCVCRGWREAGKTTWKTRSKVGWGHTPTVTPIPHTTDHNEVEKRRCHPQNHGRKGDRGMALRPSLIIRSLAQRIGPETWMLEGADPGQGPVRLKHFGSQRQAIGCFFSAAVTSAAPPSAFCSLTGHHPSLISRQVSRGLRLANPKMPGPLSWCFV